jgi:two-component system chemotaxis sensor kinase CheA
MDLIFDASPDDMKVFVQEADELIQQLDDNVLRLEKEGQNPELIQEIFRAAHTLKGSSGMLGHERMAELTHAMETLFDKLRKNEIGVTTELIDVFLDCLDALKVLKEECITCVASDIDVKTLSKQILDFAEASTEISKEASKASSSPKSGKSKGSGKPSSETKKSTKTKKETEESSGSKSAEGNAEISLSKEEIDSIHLAEISGSHAFNVYVKISDESGMPSVRLYQVVEELQAVGTIVKSMPDMATIENGECGFEIRLMVLTDEDHGHIESIVKSISELDIYTVKLFEVEEHEASTEDAVEENSNVTEITRTDERVTDLGAEARGKSPQELNQMKAAAVKTVRVDVERLDHLMNLVGELVIGKTRLLQIGSDLADNYRLGEISGTLNEVTAHIGQITNELQEEVMRARMLPIEQVFNKFPRLVRDLARNMNKQIEFVVEGKETEIDRSVLEEIGDPLIHIIRNAIDHGVETPEERKRAGKPAQGNVYLGARHEENHIVVEVSDDGKGMDAQKLKDKAVERGFLTPEAAEKMSDRDAFDLIFYSGFSTAEKLTEVSGRGVGMDVVRNNIKKINGTVEIDSELGKGSKFIIKLPLTLVIVDALIVVVGKNLYAIPLATVKEVLQLNQVDIKKVAKMETLLLRGSVLPLLKLNELFGRGGYSEDEKKDGLHVVVVGYGENKVGLVVDHLVSKMEIMIKALGDYLGDVDGVSGATILGDGRVALVVDPISLIAKVDSQQSLTSPTFGLGAGSRRIA